jgi:hypothetical protein
MFEQGLQTLIDNHVGTEGRQKLIDDMERAIGTLRSAEAGEQKERIPAE